MIFEGGIRTPCPPPPLWIRTCTAYPVLNQNPISFLGLSTCLLSVCLSVCLIWWHEQTIVILEAFICTYILFVDLTFIFGLITLSFVFCHLCLKFCLQNGIFRLLSFAFCVLTFSFLLLSFVFKLLCFVFWL